MSRLFLLRHAKAGWALPGMRDFDRPLDASGHADAEATGAAMRSRGYVPDITLCSNAAARPRDAGRHRRPGGYGPRAVLRQALQRGCSRLPCSSSTKTPNSGSILVIGHNPMMEDLATAISGDGDPSARAMLNSGFPTSGLAVIAFPGSLKDASPGNGYLEAFHTAGRPLSAETPFQTLRPLPISGVQTAEGRVFWRQR